jgi:hypothetical protein
MGKLKKTCIHHYSSTGSIPRNVDMSRNDTFIDGRDGTTSRALRSIFDGVPVFLRVPNLFHSIFLAESVLKRYRTSL